MSYLHQIEELSMGMDWVDSEQDLPDWVKRNWSYLEPVFGTKSMLRATVDGMQFYKGCKSMSDVAWWLRKSGRVEFGLLKEAPDEDMQDLAMSMGVLLMTLGTFIVVSDGVIQVFFNFEK